MVSIAKQNRIGAISSALIGVLVSVAMLACLIVLLTHNQENQTGDATVQTLTVYCAPSQKVPMDEIASRYAEECGVQVQFEFQPSELLLSSIETSGRGDLFLPADSSYVELAKQRGLVDEIVPLCSMTAVLALKNNASPQAATLGEVLKGDARLIQANDRTAIGKLTKAGLTANGRWAETEARTRAFLGSVTNVGNDVKVGSADVGIIWDAMAGQYPDLRIVRAPELADVKAHVAISVVRNSKQPTAALRFARYIAARDRGLSIFEKNGYTIVEGDAWSVRPQLKFFAGAMLRPAIQSTIRDFEAREGVSITCVYDGCGVLVADMKAGVRPDMFLACDKPFMDQVHDLFLDTADVSTNELVIVVVKGNPLGINSLSDLGQRGVRLGIGNEHKCALGVLTQTTLQQSGHKTRVSRNVKVQSSTGDTLVNSLLTGSLDAVIAYRSNLAAAPDKLAGISIDLPCAVAIQPVAVGRSSDHQQLAKRFLQQLQSSTSASQFIALGFGWSGESPATSHIVEPN